MSQDYIIAEGGCDTARVYGTTITFEPKVFFTQDGVRCAATVRSAYETMDKQDGHRWSIQQGSSPSYNL
jgi:hypothetical protein